MVAYTNPQKWKKEESERLRGERDQMKFIDLRFERWQVVGFNELCWGKATMDCKKPKKEERRKRKAKRDPIKFIDLRFESWQVVG